MTKSLASEKFSLLKKTSLKQKTAYKQLMHNEKK